MKKPVFVLIFCALLCVSAGALPHDGFLKIEGGAARIELKCGQKRRLRVSAGTLGAPVYKGLSFSSTNSLVAAVDGGGRVRAGLPGRAHVTVTDGAGRCDSILVTVSGGKAPALLPVIPLAVIVLIIIKNR